MNANSPKMTGRHKPNRTRQQHKNFERRRRAGDRKVTVVAVLTHKKKKKKKDSLNAIMHRDKGKMSDGPGAERMKKPKKVRSLFRFVSILGGTWVASNKKNEFVVSAYQVLDPQQQQQVLRCRRSSYRRLLRDVGSFCGESFVGDRSTADGGTIVAPTVGRPSSQRKRTKRTTTNQTKGRFNHQPGEEGGETTGQTRQHRSIPTVPSSLFRKLAESQLELLVNSIFVSSSSSTSTNGGATTANNNNNHSPVQKKKIRSAALYLPAENAQTGQLEFTPAILYPNPTKHERVFIANDSDSGVPPRLPLRPLRPIQILPGFSHASVLIPRYPMVSISTTEPGIGVVEQVSCDPPLSSSSASAGNHGSGSATALSVALFSGPQTVGVLLVSPAAADTVWTAADRQQVAKAAQSVSLALSMETERASLAEKHQAIQYALSESLHQVKNPLQALRTYGKLLQQRLAVSTTERQSSPSWTSSSASSSSPTRLLELADHLVQQSDRLVDRLRPVDELVASLSVPLALLKPAEEKALVPYYPRPPLLSSIQQHVEHNNDNNNPKLLDGSRGAPIDADPSSPSPPPPPPPTNFLGQAQLQMSFVPDVLEPVLSSFAGIAEDANIQFKVVGMDEDDLPGVIVWVEALQEAVINLLDNAVKYNTHPAPQIRVRLLPHRDDGGGVTILVEDNGPGIAAQESAAVFERGYRGCSHNSNGIVDIKPGSGLGLTIARSLVEQMGGSLQWVPPMTYPHSLGGTTMELKVFRKRANQRPTASSSSS